MRRSPILSLVAAISLAAFGLAAAQTAPTPASLASASKILAIRQVDAAPSPDNESVVVGGQTVWLRKKPLAEGPLVKSALQTVDFAGRPRVLVHMSMDGAMERGLMGRQKAGTRVALVAGGKVLALPVLADFNGYESFVIRIDGLASTAEAVALAAELSPTPLVPRDAYTRHVSPDKAVAAAAAKGDVKRVMQLGGTPLDVIAAERAILARDPAAQVNPARPGVPLYRWLESMDENLAAGKVPVFIQDNGRTYMAQLGEDGRLISTTAVPGMNGPDVPLRGDKVHITTPDEIVAQLADQRMASLPRTLEEAIAGGDTEGVSYHKGTMRQYFEATRNQFLSRGDQTAADGVASLLEKMKNPDTPAPPYVPPARTAAEFMAQADARMKELNAKLSAMPPPR